MELPKIYNPKEVENKIYKLWEKSSFFNPDKLPGKRKKTYTIVIPPPNITGSLHMGHALNITVQDVLIRWKRLQGYKTLWLPGTDHAGIATQNAVEKELKKEEKTRFDLGKELFIERVWQWRTKYGNIILEQFKQLGCSLDWSRTRFTMDKNYVQAVETAFQHYYKNGWIYKGKRVVNWCPRCQTSLSDLEIEYKEEKGNLWYIKYPLKKETALRQTQVEENRFSSSPFATAREGDNNFIIVATTRPETMLGDTAVAVNPKDKRYKDLIGKKVILPLVNRKIPIIADRLVDPEFGTGAVKITPAHDLNDYEISLRHNLPMIQVIDEHAFISRPRYAQAIDEEAKIIGGAPLPYQGMKVFEARQKVVEDLKELGLLEKVENYTHQVPKCYRCSSILELIPSEQWFLKMKELAKMAIEAVKSGKVKFISKSFEKIYFDWLKNIRDWCISRQIWWGHKIPLKGETDVLDTWFSSALWPFATLGWPKKTKDLKRFYPTDVLVTARDIIPLWVVRMIFSGVEFMKKIPFKNVYIHPIVLTREGKRMSKSLGTGVDPINLIEKYGADATRFGIVWQIMGGQDIRFAEDNIVMGRKFCNKIWNATRFILLQIKNRASIYGSEGEEEDEILFAFQNLNKNGLTQADKKILKALDKIIKSVNKDLENFRFGKSAHKLYDFFWHDFCDVYIEKAKIQKDKKNTQKILLYVLLNSLKLLHPFIPFITEEIYQKLPIKNKKRSLMVEEWPSRRG